MKKVFLFGLLCTSLAMVNPVSAADTPTPGQRLGRPELQKMGTLPSYRIGKGVYRVLPGAGSPQTTLLVDMNNVVGVSNHEVTIGKVSEDIARNALRQFAPQPLQVDYFKNAGITVARYADFQQAWESYQALQKLLPDANVGLPLRFGNVPH